MGKTRRTHILREGLAEDDAQDLLVLDRRRELVVGDDPAVLAQKVLDAALLDARVFAFEFVRELEGDDRQRGLVRRDLVRRAERLLRLVHERGRFLVLGAVDLRDDLVVCGISKLHEFCPAPSIARHATHTSSARSRVRTSARS